MNARNVKAVRRWAQVFGWDERLAGPGAIEASGFGIFRKGSQYIAVSFRLAPPGGNIAYRTTSPDQDEPDFAVEMSTLLGWFSGAKPEPPAPAPRPAPPKSVARPVARFKEMEF